MSIGNSACIAALSQKNGDSLSLEVGFEDAVEAVTPFRVQEAVSLFHLK